jgi:molybdate transport system substrate-binding protein
MYRRVLATSAAMTAAVLLVAGCGSGSGAAPATTAHPGNAGNQGSAVSGTITVLAAASLQGSFGTLAKQFEAAHPGTRVKLSFGASSALALQIIQGAPADVFASASVKNMTQVTDAHAASAPTTFARNVMEIAVPPSNPARITALADLARPGVKVALCQSQVPCGATAGKVFGNAKLSVKPVTLEADVKSTLAKVELDEVDAGVVYVTDVLAAGSKVTGIQIPAQLNAATAYPIAALSRAANPAGAQAFTAYVLSAAGQAVLAAAGFEKP